MKCFPYVLFLVGYCMWCWGMGQGSFFTYGCLFPEVTSGEDLACQCRLAVRTWVQSLVGKIPWRRAWRHTPVFLLESPHGQKSLVGCILWSRTQLKQLVCPRLFQHHLLNILHFSSVIFFLKFLVEFSNETIWVWIFLCGKVLSYKSNVLNR